MKSLSQMIRLLRLQAGCGFTEEECKAYGFAGDADLGRALGYMSTHQFTRVYRRALHRGKQWHALEDKWIIERFFEGVGIPVPKTYGLLHPHWGTTLQGAPLRNAEDLAALIREHRPESLIIKPRGGRMGRHVLGLRPEESGAELRLRDAEGSWTVEEFIARLPRDAFRDYQGEYFGWLIQERVRQHPGMARFNPDSLNSIRLVSFLTARGDCQIHYGAVRMGRQGTVADNWDQGGLAVLVDPATGVLGRGIFKGVKRMERLEEHPDTGVWFAGEQVPMWEEITRLVRRAAIHLSGTISVGWDIGLSEEGPVLIEGNASWALRGPQLCTANGCLTPEIRKELAEHGVVFPDHPDQLPGVTAALAKVLGRKASGWLKRS